MACSSFGTTSNGPSSDAGVAAPTTDASPGGDGESDGGACAAKTFDLATFVEERGGTNLVDGVLTSTVTSQNDAAYRELHLPAASSLVMDFELEATGTTGAYAELGCMLDLFHHDTEEFPVTEMYFVHETNRTLTFQIVHARAKSAADADLFELAAGQFAPAKATHAFRLALDAIEDERLAGVMTLDGAPRPFDVVLPSRVVRITAYCGVYYSEVSSGATFEVTVRRFTGALCPR